VQNRNIIAIVGAAAVVLVIIFYIALTPREPEVDPYVVKLEQDVGKYTGQIDSLNSVVDTLNSRLDVIRSQMDSSQAANQTLLASLHRVANEMREYQRLYKEQQSAHARLRQEISQVREEKQHALVEVRSLKGEVDSLNHQLYEKTVRLVRLESNLEAAVTRSKQIEETVSSVLVLIGTEDELKRKGYLDTGRNIVFRKHFKVVGFPDVTESGGDVLRVPVGETLPLSGKLDVLCDRHGKLGEGDEYEKSEGPGGQSIVTFVDQTLMGQRILAVLKDN
jgi:predicted  nucleic acid-binding Zn-ribbon protein